MSLRGNVSRTFDFKQLLCSIADFTRSQVIHNWIHALTKSKTKIRYNSKPIVKTLICMVVNSGPNSVNARWHITNNKRHNDKA